MLLFWLPVEAAELHACGVLSFGFEVWGLGVGFSLHRLNIFFEVLEPRCNHHLNEKPASATPGKG